MSYWPALVWPSWKAFALNESYGSVRNCTWIPVAFSKSGMIVFLNGVRAPSSKAPITSLPPVVAVADPDDVDAAAELLLELAPHAASHGAPTAAVPAASPRRRMFRRLTDCLSVMTRPFAHRGTLT